MKTKKKTRKAYELKRIFLRVIWQLYCRKNIKLLINTFFNIVIDNPQEKHPYTPKSNIIHAGAKSAFHLGSRSERLQH